MKRKILFLIFSFTMNSVIAQWTQTNGPEGCYPSCFARTSNGILCGSHKGIYISTNEGQTWEDYIPFSNYSIQSLLTFSDTIVVIYSDIFNDPNLFLEYDSVFSSTSFDGGQSWSPPILVDTYSLYPFKLHSFGNLIIGENMNEMFKSYNYGLTWTTINLPSGQFNNNFIFTNKYLLISAAPNPYYYISDTTLNFQRFDISNNIFNKCMIDTIIFGYKKNIPGKFEIVKSIDLGQTWDSIQVVDSSFNFQFGTYDNTLYYTYPFEQYHISTDLGLTWVPSQLPYQLKFWMRFPLLNGDEIVVANLQIFHYDKNNDSTYLSEKGIRGQDINLIKGSNEILYCYSGSVLFSTIDDGLTWVNKGYPPFAPWVDNNTIIINGDSLFSLLQNLYVSFDGGIMWTLKFTVGSCRDLAKRGNRIYISWWDLTAYSDDFGNNWFFLPDIPSFSDCNENYSQGGKMCVLNNNLFVITGEGVAYKLDIGDTTWTYSFCFPLDIFSNNNDPDIKVIDNNLIVTCDSTMFISNDGGANWTYPLLNGIPIDRFGEKICPKSIVGENGDLLGICNNQIYISSNGGNDWTLFSSQPSNFIPTGLEIVNHKLFAGSEHSSVWTNNIILDISKNNFKFKSSIKIYPNPSSKLITISFDNFHSGNYRLLIYNNLGIEVDETQINSEKTQIDISDLSGGIYYGKVISFNGQISGNFKFSVVK